MAIPKSKHIRMLGSLLFLSLLFSPASQFLFPSVLAQEDFGEIVVGVPAHFPPQYYVDEETGEPYGFAIDVMDEIAARSDLEIRYVVFDTWPEVTEAMQKEEIDVIPNSGVVAERDANSNYTANVEVFTIGIITRTSTMDIHSIDDLSDRHVAVVSMNKGFYIMEEYEDVDLHVYNSLEEAFYSLISGDTDALVYPNEQVIRIAIQLDIEDQIKVVGEPLLEVKRAIAVRKDQTELFDVLDKEVKAFVATPEYGEIYAKWYGVLQPYWSAERVAIVMGTVFVLILTLLLGWHYFSTLGVNKSLRSSIIERKRTEEKNKKSAKELAKAYEELKSVDKMKEEFLSSVSHELKTPLVSIKGYSEVLNDCTLGELNDQQKKAVDTVMRNANRLERLINSILYLSVEEAGKMQYTFKPLQIADVIERSILDMLPQIKSNDLNIKKELADNLPLIQADEDRMIQVMMNLISNAIKFTPSGEITITAQEDDDNLHVTVSDTGIGMSPEMIVNSFERFYQGDASTKRRYGGTGLGLHISKHIIEAHKGRIWAESEEGVGTTIHFTLPK